MDKTNYHTHTKRCKHAIGEDREYIECAIKNGFKVLGFSDHCPFIYNGYTSFMRMNPEDVEGYFYFLTNLKAEYKKEIEILIGFEEEYFPSEYFNQKKTARWLSGGLLYSGTTLFITRTTRQIYWRSNCQLSGFD